VKILHVMGVAAAPRGGDAIIATPPEYRNDFLHPVDIAEEIMIGRGMKSFAPEMPSDFTIGRLTPLEEFGRRAVEIMVGEGYQEMIFPYLWSGRDLIDRMRPMPLRESPLREARVDDEPAGVEQEVVRLANPMSEGYEYLRNSIIPCLLSSESVSAHAVYPHRIFELGKVERFAPAEETGVRTVDSLAFVISGAGGFSELNADLQALLYYLGREAELAEHEDLRFVSGRCARIVVNGRPVGECGEIHPQVLENWGIQVPCTACEIDLGALAAAESTAASVT
jgi:phenylalanyl-tRNA synthetase beta chain